MCSEVSKGIANVSLDSGVPVLFGVLTTENLEQAIERAGSKAGNKGYDCALSAIEMVNLPPHYGGSVRKRGTDRMIIIRSKQNDPALEEQILALLRREHIEAEQFSLSTQQPCPSAA